MDETTSTTPPAPAPLPDHAIVVGIAHYPGIGNLEGPLNDARDFVDWLTTQGGVDPANVECILSVAPEDGDVDAARPTVEQIQAAFRKLVKAGRETGRVGRRLYIYLSGHGFAPDARESALLTANASMDDLGYHIPGELYADWFYKAGYFQEVILFMDCCRDNDYGQSVVNRPPWNEVQTAGAKVARCYALATKWSRKSFERPGDEGGPVHGVFTQAVLAGLRGEAEKDGRITGESLRDFVFNRLRHVTAGRTVQEPEIAVLGGIVFRENVTPPLFAVKLIFDSGAGEDLTVRLLDRSFQPVPDVGSHRVQDGPWETSLPKGFYLLQVEGDSSRGGTIEVIEEGEYHVHL